MSKSRKAAKAPAAEDQLNITDPVVEQVQESTEEKQIFPPTEPIEDPNQNTDPNAPEIQIEPPVPGETPGVPAPGEEEPVKPEDLEEKIIVPAPEIPDPAAPAAEILDEDDDDELYEQDDSKLRLIGKDKIPDFVENGQTLNAGFDKYLRPGSKVKKKGHTFEVLAHIGTGKTIVGNHTYVEHLIKHIETEEGETTPMKAKFFRGTFEEIEK